MVPLRVDKVQNLFATLMSCQLSDSSLTTELTHTLADAVFLSSCHSAAHVGSRTSITSMPAKDDSYRVPNSSWVPSWLRLSIHHLCCSLPSSKSKPSLLCSRLSPDTLLTLFHSILTRCQVTVVPQQMSCYIVFLINILSNPSSPSDRLNWVTRFHN